MLSIQLNSKMEVVSLDKIICYTDKLPAGTIQEVSFLELLLDETWAEGELDFSDSIYSETGNINHKLTAKQNYEFLLRAAKKFPLQARGILPDNEPLSSSQAQNFDPEGFLTDCYIIGKYQQELRDSGYFNQAIESLLTTVYEKGVPAEAAANLLEKMITHSEEYYEIDDAVCPILLYKGNAACYHQLDTFADELAKALLSCRQRIEIFDTAEDGVPGLMQYIGRHFKAVIGIQTYLFSVMMQDKTTNLHDLIIGPKLNLILDHPAWLKEHISHGPKNYYLLSHDQNYINFAAKYFKGIKGCYYLAPGGMNLPLYSESLSLTEGKPADGAALPGFSHRSYDLSFIGSYYDYRHILDIIRSMERPLRFLTAHFLREMKQNVDLPAEAALKNVLHNKNIMLTDKEFLDTFFKTRFACFCVAYYYRERIIGELLEARIPVHVYGNSWLNSPFAAHPCLIRHPGLTPEECLLVMQQSKISLNIMTWHKDGLTERVLNSMLCQSVVVSDKSTSLEKYFVNQEDLVLFSLEHINELPRMVRKLLSDERDTQNIALNGCKKCLKEHLWIHRASSLLEILENSIH